MAAPTLSDGTTTLTLNINQNLPESESPNIVIHSIPSRSGSILQNMGRESKRITLNGYTTVQAEKNSLKNWARAGTKLIYNDDENTNINVILVSPVTFTRKPSMPSYYEYSLVLIENE